MIEKEYIERDKIELNLCLSVDVRPMVRGKWVDEPIKGVKYHCSVCQGRFDHTWHFCPNCGADMRGNNE